MKLRRHLLAIVALVAILFAAAPAHAALPTDSGWPLDRLDILRPFDPPGQRYGSGHRGLDLAARPGDPVRAAASGSVSVARSVAGRGVVTIDHGGVRTTYEPVSALVVEGSQVRTGDVIGRIGTGGHCNDRCLHWGLIEGKDHYLDPMLLAPGGDPARVRLLGPDLAQRARAQAAARARQLEAETETAVADYALLGPPGGRSDFRHPVPGPITSKFGVRFHPVLHVWKLHDGTDFGAACGTPIVAAAAGTVSGGGPSRGYGNRLMIDHGRVGGREVVTGYNHATRYVVRTGQRVKTGQLIGYVGSTGYATGCHLHLMLWLDGKLRNPMTWFAP